MARSILKTGECIDQLFLTDVKIIQSKDVFSYSIDSALLPHFLKTPSRGLIVNLCPENGAVGLFTSMRTRALIIEIELQERLASMAERSIQLNQSESRVQMIDNDLKSLLNHVPRSGVDLILCNLSYFKVSEMSKKNLSEHYLPTRHEIAASLGKICGVTRHALKSNGRLAMVHRPDRFLDIIDTIRQYNLASKRIQFVYPRVGEDANMPLTEAIEDGSTDRPRVLPPFFIHKENGGYTDDTSGTYYGKNGRRS